MTYTETTIPVSIQTPDRREVTVLATFRGRWEPDWGRWIWRVTDVQSLDHAPGLSTTWAAAEVFRRAPPRKVERALDDAAGRVGPAWMPLGVEMEVRP